MLFPVISNVYFLKQEADGHKKIRFSVLFSYANVVFDKKNRIDVLETLIEANKSALLQAAILLLALTSTSPLRGKENDLILPALPQLLQLS